MKPQVLDLSSEVLSEFRNRFDFALSALIRNLVDKDLTAGEVSGKVKIEINKATNEETGEIMMMPVIKPEVHLKVNAKGKIECGQMEGMVMRMSPCGEPVVASNQISMDELMEAERRA